MDIVPDDVVISGVGGYFPKAVNIEEFKQRLFENNYLLEQKWPEDKNMCTKVGPIDSDYFDNSYFGIHRQQCFFMDPMHRLALERTFEALIDAGVNPNELRGKRIGVFMGSTIGENDQLFMESVVSGFGVTGHSRAMLANRISYWLNLKGPSVAYDANWVSGVEVLRLAYYAVKTGQCDSVIIGTTNLAQHVQFQFMYNDMGILSQDGSTKAYDANATGYGRAEGVVVMYIQRSSEARRLYASVESIATKFDGTTPGDFLDIPTESMVDFLEEFYKKSKVKPEEIEFVEAYGCGNKVIDKNEIDALEKVLCKSRSKPLLVGSVKTVTGHAEASAAMLSLVKAIVALETETIPATLQHETPNPEIKAFRNGTVEVVTDNRKWDPKYVAVNCLSTSAYFGHVVMKANPKKKVPISIDLPTLLIASTRTEEGMTNILERMKSKPKDAEYYKLVHEVFSKSIQGHLYRGYLLLGEEETKQETINHMGNKRPIWFVYSGMGSQWNGMLGDLMKIEVFANSIYKCRDILAKKGVDLMNILSSSDKNIFDNILNCFVGIAAMQIALTDVLRALGIVPDGIIGHSVGELGCAYADGCMTAEQMIMSSYSRGRASIEATLIKGMMAATGLGYNQIKNRVPPTIEVACHNGPDSCTISGPTEDMEQFVKTLQNQGVFAKLVNVANIAYHSRYIKPAAPLLLKYLKEVLPKPMLRSSKWVSTSNLEANWDTDLAKHSSAEYHTNNLLSSVLFEEGIKHIPKDSVLIEIAPHGLLQAILKRSVKECTSIPLTQRGAKSSVEFLMQSLGKIYLSGVDLKLANIYPKIEYPVSRNTPSLGDLVEWNHSESWSRIEETQESIVGVRNIDINLSSEEFHYCNAHKLHGQVVLPVSTYLNIILQITENAFGGLAVIIENMHLKKQLVVPVVGFIPINAMVQHGSGEFEIFSGEELLVTGKITVVEQEDEMEPLEDLEIPVTKESVHLLENDIYNELEDRGCQYKERFRRIKNMFLSQNGASAHVSWNNWEELIESMIQQQLFQSGERDQRVYVPRYIQKITICHKLLPTSPETKVNFDYSTRTLYAPGIEIHDMKTTIFRKTTLDVQLNSEDIVPLDNVVNDIESGIEQAVQLTLSNLKEQSVNKIFISELETAVPLENNIKNVMSNYSYHVNQSLVKEIKQIVMSESYPQLLVMNNFVNSDLMKLLHNSENAFLLAKVDPDRSLDQNVAIVARFRCGPDHYIICRKVMNTKPRIINITEKTISLKDLDKKSAPWVSELLKNPQDSTPTLLVTSSVPVEGFSNFIDRIRSLPNLRNVRIFYNLDQNSAKVEEAFKKNLSLTLLKDNHWYTYLPLTLKKKEKSDKKSSPTPIIENKLIRYIGLNLKDETLAPALRNNNEIGNIDYCGVTKNGQRVMGLAQLDKESSKLVVDDILTWEVPDDFSLEDAITIPHAYACAYYMIVVKGRIKHGETVLIHKGCSPIGLAAISIAYSYGCQIFTTVTTQRQNVYLRKVYSYLAERNVLDANSSNFETDVMFATGGKGVELLLNCVSGVLLKSSVACMGFYGRFIQYGQYDLEQGNCIGMSIFLKNVDFYHVDLQNIFRQDKETKQQIRQLITDGFKNFVVRPLRKEILSHQNIASVIKKLESPETIGKIAIDAVNNLSINKLNIKEPNRFICNSRSSYLVFGGSTSSWIQLIEWLVHRGARKIVVSTDKKPAENHLNRRLAILENYYGADIIMASSKIQSRNNADQLVSEVTNLGPLHAMFVLPVGSVGEETVELFDGSLKSLAPKALLVNFLKAATGICYQRAIAGFLTNNIQVQNEEEMKDIISSLDVILDSNVSNVLAKKFISIDTASDESKATIDDFTKLIPNLDDIIRLQKNAPEKPELVQVLTEGPSEIRELLPVFIIPGLTGFKELETFVRNLLYPTFCAVLPSTSWPLEKLAEVYAQKMSEIVPKPVYNIVSISSGGPLAIQIARILAKKNVSLHLYLIDSAPQRLQQGLHNLGDDNVQVEISMLRTVFELNDLELIKQLRGCPNFEARIKLLLKMVDRSDKHKVLLEKGLKLAKEFIEKIKAFKPNDELLSGRVHLLVPEDCNIYDTYGLTSYFKNLHAVEQISGNHLSIIQHKDTHEYVNKNHYQI